MTQISRQEDIFCVYLFITFKTNYIVQVATYEKVGYLKDQRKAKKEFNAFKARSLPPEGALITSIHPSII